MNKQNFQIQEGVGKSSCLTSYEPKLISKNKVNITSEITFYNDITKILNTIPILEAEGKDLKQKMLNEILPENINNLHSENILENNENNIKSLINNINIALEDKDQTIDLEEIGSTDYYKFLTIINKRIDVDFEEYNKLYGNEKEYNFISYEIDNLPDGFQITDDFNIDKNEILKGPINIIEKKDSTQNLQEFDREKSLLEIIRYQNLPENSVTRSTLSSGVLVASHSSLLAPAKARVRTSYCAYTYPGFVSIFEDCGHDARCELADTHRGRGTHTQEGLWRGERASRSAGGRGDKGAGLPDGDFLALLL